jgi:hypothetical protein
MNTAVTDAATRLPCPPTPPKLNHCRVIGRLPEWWVSEATRPATARPIRIVYSITAMPTCVRAVRRMPTMPITSITTITATPMAMFAHAPPLPSAPNTASTDGPITSPPDTPPVI